MPYKVTKGISESDLPGWLETARKKYGLYRGKAVNYTNANIAPVVMITIKCGNKILLVKRGYGLADAEGYWSTVNGFIDEVKPVAELAKRELKEELNIEVDLSNILVAKSFTMKNPKEKRAYIVFPCLVKLENIPVITLNSENTDYVWIERESLHMYETLEDLPYIIDQSLSISTAR